MNRSEVIEKLKDSYMETGNPDLHSDICDLLEALQDIEMTPRIISKVTCESTMQRLAQQALLKFYTKYGLIKESK